ncbi:MAG: hypothetical protein OQK82_02875 [Candidatus Pacearchaeota archaeon]|nr:hypothetical protein [Candidatus Pacearchaeota archaeon]
MKFNAEWHRNNPFPKGGSFEEKLRWHLEHIRCCGCFKFPIELRKDL